MPLPPRQPPPATRSGSNPDDIHTVVVPAQPGYYPEPSSSDQAKASSPAQPPTLSLGSAKLALGMMAGALVICVLGLGVVIWLQATGNRGPAMPLVPPLTPAQPAGKEEPIEDPVQSRATAKEKSPEQESVSIDASKSGHISSALEPAGQPLVAATPRLQLLVPAYFYPAGPGLEAWERLMEAASKIRRR